MESTRDGSLDAVSNRRSSLPQLLLAVVKDVLYGPANSYLQGKDDESKSSSSSFVFIQRARHSLLRRSPELKDACRHIISDIVLWMNEGGPWRAFLVFVVGVVLFLGLTGFCTLVLFFLAATVNAVVVAFLASVASVGAFAALFFTLITVIYIGALIVAVCSISTITFLCISAVLVAAGLIAFLWLLCQGFKKGVQVLRTSLVFSIPGFGLLPSFGTRQLKNAYH